MIYSYKGKGDIVSWDIAHWNVNNMVEKEATYDEICRGQELRQEIFPGLRNYTTSMILCQNVRGNIIQIENEAQQQNAVALLTNRSICSMTASWIGWSDDDQEGNWVSPLNSSVSLGKEHFKSWAQNEPNGETNENCAVVSGRNGRQNAYIC